MENGKGKMAQIILTERHKQMLTALAEALKTEAVGVEWILATAADGIMIMCLDRHVDSPTRLTGWASVGHADLEKFTSLGLMRAKRYDSSGLPDYYILDEAYIIHLVDRNFEAPTPGIRPITLNITSPNSILNIQSTLNNSTQTVHNSPSLQESDKQMLETLLNDLKTALTGVPAENADDAETVAMLAERLTQDVASAKPNKNRIQISADGLKKAADNIAAIAQPVILAVTAILEFVSKLHR